MYQKFWKQNTDFLTQMPMFLKLFFDEWHNIPRKYLVIKFLDFWNRPGAWNHYYLQICATKTTAYYISPIEIGVFWAKITCIKSHSKALGFSLQTDMK